MTMCIQLLFIIAFLINVNSYELKQVIILSRHNIRTPYRTTNLELCTSKNWPSWKGVRGDLTLKGWLLERSMGKYFSDWMIEKNLFDNNCPEDQAFVYANTKQRTKETARSFVEGAFGDCASVYYKNTTEMDPVFDLIIRNDTEEFKEIISNEMEKKLNQTELRDAFIELNRLVDFRNSSYCKTENVCDLSEEKNRIILELNKAPDLTGALRIGFNVVDAFLMSYYDGMSLENVAWGEIKTEDQWEALLSVLNTFQQLRFGTKILDRHIASALLKYFSDIFKNGEKKFYLLVGHDANISALMSCLNFKDYVLRDQFEKTPIGGKLVFQKWYDEKEDRDLLRVNYVYQSSKQIRDGVEVSLQKPPCWVTLEMENCTVDKNGFCLWNDFISILNTM